MPKRNPNTPTPMPATWLGRWFTSARRAGFLALLTPEVWHTLSAILSFTSRDGRRSFTADQLAHALGISRELAAQRLETFAQVRWHDAPLGTVDRDRDGQVAGLVLAPLELLAQVEANTDSRSTIAASRTAPDSIPAHLRTALVEAGLEVDQIEHLVRTFPVARIERQVAWLPEREARNPAALLIRAIEQDWDPPKGSA